MFSVSCHLLSVLIKARTYTDIQLLMQFVHIKDRDIAFSCLFIECVCVYVCVFRSAFAALSSCSLQGLLHVSTTRWQKATQRMKRRDFWRLRSVTCDVPWTVSCLPRRWWPRSVAITFLEAGRVKTLTAWYCLKQVKLFLSDTFSCHKKKKIT